MREFKVIADLPGYPPEVGAALWRLEDSRRRTLEVLGEIGSIIATLEARK